MRPGVFSVVLFVYYLGSHGCFSVEGNGEAAVQVPSNGLNNMEISPPDVPSSTTLIHSDDWFIMIRVGGQFYKLAERMGHVFIADQGDRPSSMSVATDSFLPDASIPIQKPSVEVTQKLHWHRWWDHPVRLPSRHSKKLEV